MLQAFQYDVLFLLKEHVVFFLSSFVKKKLLLRVCLAVHVFFISTEI
jgi:hypothetical protein